MKGQKGFTIIEAMLSAILLGLIFVGVVRFFRNTLDVWFESSRQIDIQRKGRAAVDEMTRFIRQSSAPVTAIYPSIGITDTKIKFIYMGESGDRSMKYYQGDGSTRAEDPNGSALFRVVDGNTTTLIGNFLDEIYFVHESSYIVNITSMTLTKRDQVITFNKNIYLRNR